MVLRNLTSLMTWNVSTLWVFLKFVPGIHDSFMISIEWDTNTMGSNCLSPKSNPVSDPNKIWPAGKKVMLFSLYPQKAFLSLDLEDGLPSPSTDCKSIEFLPNLARWVCIWSTARYKASSQFAWLFKRNKQNTSCMIPIISHQGYMGAHKVSHLHGDGHGQHLSQER